MKLNALEKIIRKVVREEIDYALRREFALLKEEISTTKPLVKETPSTTNKDLKEEFRTKIKSQLPSFNSGNPTLDSLLSETATTPTAEEVFNANDPINQFVNKDYSQIMNAIDKKKDFRP